MYITGLRIFMQIGIFIEHNWKSRDPGRGLFRLTDVRIDNVFWIFRICLQLQEARSLHFCAFKFSIKNPQYICEYTVFRVLRSYTDTCTAAYMYGQRVVDSNTKAREEGRSRDAWTCTQRRLRPPFGRAVCSESRTGRRKIWRWRREKEGLES